MAEPGDLVEVSVDEQHVALVRLDSPETRNSLSPQMKEQLIAALERLDGDPDVRCAVVAGSEEIFAAGTDIRVLAEQGPTETDPEGAAFWSRLAAIETPLVAAVCGYALGAGCELALACDLVVADERARFGLPEVTLGIIPGGGGTQRLARVIGKQLTMEFVLTGRRFDAEMAVSWGLINKAVPRRKWLSESIQLARTVAERPPVATRLAKRAVLNAEELGVSEAIAAERQLFDRAMATEDRVEGMQAFLEQREPEFRGR